MESFCRDLTRYLKSGGTDVEAVLGPKFMELVKGDDPVCPCAKYLFWGIDETVETAVYVLRQLAGAISGLRRGFEEYLLFIGTTGGNPKGAIRKLLRGSWAPTPAPRRRVCAASSCPTTSSVAKRVTGPAGLRATWRALGS